MKETQFLRQNKEKWERFERELSGGKVEPEVLASNFIETTDDLAYARTFYSKRSIRVYLNGVAKQFFKRMYRNHTGGLKQLSLFWRRELPNALYIARPQLFLSAILFVLGIAIGWFSSVHRPDFASVMLGESYVAMTESFIASGDPMAVYKQMDPWPMFLLIAWNNAQVSFIMFALGVFFCAGTVLAMLRNSIMVGAFVFFFYERDLFQESFLTIMMHGTIELSVLVLASTAGLVVGRGLVFPGTYNRMTAFVISGRQGVKIMMGLLPFEIFAAFIEGFITRYTEVPDIIRALLILLSIGLMVTYFVYYPWALHRAGKFPFGPPEDLSAFASQPFVAREVKSAGRMFNEVFGFFNHRIGTLVGICVSLAFGYMALFAFSHDFDLVSAVDPGFFASSADTITYLAGLIWYPDDIGEYVKISDSPVCLAALMMSLAAVVLWASRSFIGRAAALGLKGLRRMSVIGSVLASGGAAVAFLLPFVIGAWGGLLAIGLWPWVIIFIAAFFLDSGPKGVWHSVWRTFSKGRVRLWLLLLYVFGIQSLILMLVNAPLQWLTFDIIGTMLPADAPFADQIPYFVHGLGCVTAFLLGFALCVYAAMIYFLAQSEILNASSLRQRIAEIQPRKSVYGIEEN